MSECGACKHYWDACDDPSMDVNGKSMSREAISRRMYQNYLRVMAIRASLPATCLGRMHMYNNGRLADIRATERRMKKLVENQSASK